MCSQLCKLRGLPVNAAVRAGSGAATEPFRAAAFQAEPFRVELF